MGIWDKVSKMADSITPDALSENKRVARYMIIGLAYVTAADGEVDANEKEYAKNFVRSQRDILKYFAEAEAMVVFDENLDLALKSHQIQMFKAECMRLASETSKKITTKDYRVSILSAMERMSVNNDRGVAGNHESEVLNLWRSKLL